MIKKKARDPIHAAQPFSVGSPLSSKGQNNSFLLLLSPSVVWRQPPLAETEDEEMEEEEGGVHIAAATVQMTEGRERRGPPPPKGRLHAHSFFTVQARPPLSCCFRCWRKGGGGGRQ